MAKVPNLPPVTAIADPAVRTYLQALSDAWGVRNGQAGDGSQKFMTAADLQQVFSGGQESSASTSGASAYRAQGAVGPAISRLGDLYRRMVDDIVQSWLYKNLSSEIERMELPAWFSVRVGAMIKTEREERVSQNSALAKSMETAISRINENIAQARTEISSLTTQTSATAKQVTRLQTEIGGATAKAEQAFTMAQNINGDINASWGVRLNAAGAATGFGLGLSVRNGVASSVFGVVAERFWVMPPSGSSGARKPFVFENGVAYMDSAFIRDASISSAQIISVAADKIDTRGLLVRDHAGNIILGAGHALDGSTYIKHASVDTLTIAGRAINDTNYVRGDFVLQEGTPVHDWNITPPNRPARIVRGCYYPLGRVTLRHTPIVALIHLHMWSFSPQAIAFGDMTPSAYVYIMRNGSVCIWAGYIGKTIPRLGYPENSATPDRISLLHNGTEGTSLTLTDSISGGTQYEYGVFITGSDSSSVSGPLPYFNNTRFVIDFTLQGQYR